SHCILQFDGFRVTGTTAAPFTPFKEDGEVNYDLISKCVDFLKNNHFEYAFVNGTLAEGLSMTLEERKKVAEAWKSASEGKIKLILHIGTNCLKDSQELARHAQQIGVEAVAALCPFFLKPESEEILVDYIEQVAKEAPKLPFFYYAINFFTGIYLNDSKFLRLAKDRIPNLCGLKHSSRELPNAFDCKLVDKKFQVLMGTDNQFLTCLSLGLDVPVTAPFMGKLYHEIKTAFDKGDIDEARKIQIKVQKVNNIRQLYGGGIEAAKVIFSITSGIDCGPVRLPLTNFSADRKASLAKDLKESGLFS
ncbi:hypothetical protein FSP39_014195, partial [Pinctada imbricata]